MAVYDNRHSRLVGWLKILLPLAALGLLSSMFLLSSGPDGDGTIPFSEIEELAREQRISEPYFAGVADDGSVMTISARSARPDGTNGLTVDALTARMEATDGSTVSLSAGTGSITNGGRTAQLDGLVRVETSSGYRIETTGLVASLDSGRLETNGALKAIAPFGELTAGALTVETPPDSEDGTRLLFTGGVRLLYQPDNEER